MSALTELMIIKHGFPSNEELRSKGESEMSTENMIAEATKRAGKAVMKGIKTFFSFIGEVLAAQSDARNLYARRHPYDSGYVRGLN